MYGVRASNGFQRPFSANTAKSHEGEWMKQQRMGNYSYFYIGL